MLNQHTHQLPRTKKNTQKSSHGMTPQQACTWHGNLGLRGSRTQWQASLEAPTNARIKGRGEPGTPHWEACLLEFPDLRCGGHGTGKAGRKKKGEDLRSEKLIGMPRPRERRSAISFPCSPAGRRALLTAALAIAARGGRIWKLGEMWPFVGDSESIPCSRLMVVFAENHTQRPPTNWMVALEQRKKHCQPTTSGSNTIFPPLPAMLPAISRCHIPRQQWATIDVWSGIVRVGLGD